MTYVLGLTGSIGMGKSTTAQMFADEGVPVWDADGTVSKLYDKGGAAAVEIAKQFPNVIMDGAVSKDALRAAIAEDPHVLDQIQTIVHPLVAEDRVAFIEHTASPIVLLDVPLLFETGTDHLCDGVVVVTAPSEVQKDRVLARGTMSEAEFDLILKRQMPDAEKREKADWIIETLTLDATRQSVRGILTQIRAELSDA